MPIDPKKKSYYMYGLTTDRKRCEIASRLVQKDLGQTLLNNISDPDIFGDNIYIVGNYREDFTKDYYLRGLIAMSGSVSGGFMLPNTPINVGTWNPATVSIDYNTSSAVVVQKSQTTHQASVDFYKNFYHFMLGGVKQEFIGRIILIVSKETRA